MPTLIYNNNTYVRWDKDECHRYTITNLLNYAGVSVEIRDLTSDWTESFELLPEEANQVELPADGVYEICAVSLADSVVDEVTIQPVTSTQSVVVLGPMSGQDDARILEINVSGVGSIYQSTAAGGTDPDNNWTSPPASYQTVITTVQNWLNANGGGVVEIIPPNTASTNFIWLPVNLDNYTLAFLSFAGVELQSVITQQLNFQGQPQSQVFHFPDTDCLVSWTTNLENLTDPVREYVTSWIIGGVDIVEDPIFIGDGEGGYDLTALTDIINNYLALNSTGGMIPTPSDNIWWIFENCEIPGPLVLANLNPSEEECDYIYEFCDLYACTTRLITQWLCNPCPDPCDSNYVEAEEARKRAIELSTLFFHALMPIVSQDRLWHFGNWEVNDLRTCKINEIVGLYEHIRAWLKDCKFDCCDPCNDCGDCKDCDPPSGIYPYNNSKTGCNGCK